MQPLRPPLPLHLTLLPQHGTLRFSHLLFLQLFLPLDLRPLGEHEILFHIVGVLQYSTEISFPAGNSFATSVYDRSI